ncbi:MAG: LysR family transcriptional regulator [Bacteroidia bacterium]|nr:LysR family transcriptional regulator [Bacteroidia bacterium]
MNYTLHQLHVFVKIVQTKSITKASEELYMTQPAVSIQLKNFQDQFEIGLTEVIGRQIRITDFGMEIYTIAERILNEVYAINYKTEAYKGLLSGRLLISSVSTGKYVMPYFLTDFLKENSGVDLVMDVTNKAKVVGCLEKGEIDFALVSVLPEGLNIQEEILIDNELQLVSNMDYKIHKTMLSKDDLEQESLIYREEGSATRKVMEDFFNKRNIKIRKKIELTSNEAVKQAVLAGLGISLMPLIGIRTELASKRLQLIPCKGLPIKTKWRLIWLKNRKLSPAAQQYIDFVKRKKEDIAAKNFVLKKK